MAEFLTTSAITHKLEQLIKNAKERVILISPFLQLSTRIKELLEDKNRLKIDVRIIYGKSKLKAEEEAWLHKMDYIRLSFCQNLHAKCYLNENACIITSMNLYQFSQVNNNEMGILIERKAGGIGGILSGNAKNKLYDDVYEEVQRLIRISEEIQPAAEKTATTAKKPPIEKKKVTSVASASVSNETAEKNYDKLTTAKLAAHLDIETSVLREKLIAQGYIERRDGRPYLTDEGKAIGAQLRKSPRGYFVLWPKDLIVE